jgi:hypothetical protein
MTDASSHLPQNNPILTARKFIVGVFALWCITLFIGLNIDNLSLIVASFVFLAIAVVVAIFGDKTTSIADQTSHVQQSTSKLPYFLMLTIATAVPAVGTNALLAYMFYLYINLEREGIDPESGTLVFGLAGMAIVILLVAMIILTLISKRFYKRSVVAEEESSLLVIILGILLGSAFVVSLFYIIVLYH